MEREHISIVILTIINNYLSTPPALSSVSTYGCLCFKDSYLVLCLIIWDYFVLSVVPLGAGSAGFISCFALSLGVTVITRMQTEHDDVRLHTSAFYVERE